MALVGNLKDLKLPNLIQLNCMEKNVAKLMIEAREGKGVLYFEDGNIVHAVYRDKQGDEAIYSLLAIKEGLFRIENGIRTKSSTVKTPWSNLLMEGLRVLDEEKDTDSGRIKDFLQEVLAIRGVMEAEILDDGGNLIVSSVKEENREGYSYLIVFSSKQAQMLSTELSYGEIVYLNFKTPKSKIVCFKRDDTYVVIEYDQKLQIENILPDLERIKQ
jgi:predicted regulator of Ras-like GTPase activity (Roadblock/LC7/MglB family)